MSTWLVVWFVLGLITVVAMIAVFVALARHGLVLGRAAKQMQEAVQPIADDISRLAARQQDRIAEISVKGSALGSRRSTGGERR